jgi:hypothetical protein
MDSGAMGDGIADDQSPEMSAFLNQHAPARRGLGQLQKSGKGQVPPGAADHRGADKDHNRWSEHQKQ